ncbi:Ncstrn_small domain-containing protein [Meloidogyne graminicola]|uniref:Nicastrin n=1 Tax=Meloidogyne graminicola TaxID=189291 RepID=A0A8T0A050_9BILA|nr:Ncstrn_small domain-containing protein [Meloidogyne graminicola]
MFILIFYWFFLLSGADCGHLRDQIIFELNPLQTYCTRLLNGTDSVGCQSNKNGNTGVITEISSPKDIDEIVKSLPLRIDNLIALIEINNLDSKLINAVGINENIQGIILFYRGEKFPKKFSEDSDCPNKQFSFYDSERQNCHPWNSQGAIDPFGLRFKNFEKPIFYIENQTQIDILTKKCSIPYNKQIKDESLRCIGRMVLFMFAAGNSKLCLERQEKSSGLGEQIMLCDNLEDNNIFALLPPLSQKQKDLKPNIFVLAARLDSFSSIYNSHGGDFSTISSIIPLLLVADSIGKNIELFLTKTQKTFRQLLFTFFHGESLGYIGSSRWVWDMNKKQFPHSFNNLFNENIRQIGIDSIGFFMELQQIGTNKQFFLHADREAYLGNKSMVNNLIKLIDSSVNFINPLNITYGSVPPSSYHSLLKNDKNIPGLILSSFGEGKYNFNYLNSLFDIEIRNNTKMFNEYVNKIKNAAKIVLNTTLNYLFLNDVKLVKKFKIDENYAKILSECFFLKSSWDCPLFLLLTNSTNDQNIKYWLRTTANDLSIGTGFPGSGIRKIVHSILVNSLGQKGPESEQQCSEQNKEQNLFTYIWQNNPLTNNGTCYKTSIYLGKAKSPAFEIENYNFSSGQYSTWVESRWDSHARLEIFLTADYRLELYALLLAILVILLSAPLNYGLKEQWFLDNSLPPTSPQQL